MLSRRGFVGAATVMAAAGRAQAAGSPLDVVVVGGGIAGAAAASQLTLLGHRVVLLEARPRVGGRIDTDRSLSIPIDLGAAWIHGPSRANPLVALAARSGAATAVTPDGLVRVYGTNGLPLPDSSVGPKETTYESLAGRARSVATRAGGDLSFQQAMATQQAGLFNDEIMRYFGAAWTEFDTGAPLDQLSAIEGMEDGEFGGADVIVTNGYDRMLRPLVNGYEVRMNTAVTSISQRGTDVAVDHSGGTITADAVIVTVPLGVLKDRMIEFSPGLSATKLGAIGRVGFGTVNKVVLEFTRSTWPPRMQYYGFCRDVGVAGRACYALNVKRLSRQANILVVIYTGSEALRLETLSDTEATQDALAGIRPVLGAAPPPLKSSRVTRWKSQAFSRGSYSFSAVGTLSTDFDTMARPEGRLFFAGEHTHGTYRGTVHGAYLSGQRAAREVIATLG